MNDRMGAPAPSASASGLTANAFGTQIDESLIRRDRVAMSRPERRSSLCTPVLAGGAGPPGRCFPGGQGRALFLISLEVGGAGPTLTAADYEIHLDPRWKPAVEDQASDRAHRIGQTRPVTVQRLIAESTVEQQILSLHREKRERVDEIPSGTDRAGKLAAEEVAGLIRGPAEA